MKEIDKFKYAQPYLYDEEKDRDKIFYCFDSGLERKIKVMNILDKKVVVGKQNIESLSDVVYILNISKNTIYTNCENYTFIKNEFPGFYISQINYYYYYFFEAKYLKRISNEVVANIIMKTNILKDDFQREFKKFKTLEDNRIKNKLYNEKWARKRKK